MKSYTYKVFMYINIYNLLISLILCYIYMVLKLTNTGYYW